MKKICFILTEISRVPVGGYKMVYEYANRLAKDDFKVSIVYRNDNLLRKYHFPEPIRGALALLETQWEPSWFQLDKRIRKISTTSSAWKDKSGDPDIVISTAVETVALMKRYFKNSKQVYFIQDYENWNCTDQYLQNTYAAGYRNIVVSQWLKEVVDRYSKEPSFLIKNPIDLKVYRVITPPEKRGEHTISLLYHTGAHKGLKYALQVLHKLKKIYSDLTVFMFGVFDFEDEIPEWIKYTQKASQQQTVEIYNSTRVFLCATVEEGYGLTGLEAMACGNILVSTNYRGVREYAQNGYNALLSPVKDVDALVKNVERVFEDSELRKQIIKNGQETVKQFSWTEAYTLFKNAIDSL